MKKLFLLLTAAVFAVQGASAQAVEESKTFFDNWYVGVNGGVAAPMTHHSVFKNINPQAGLRVGRWITPVFGLAVEGEAVFGNKPYKKFGTAVQYSQVNVLGTTNLSNWFGGYKGEPRVFEVVALYGMGWATRYGTKSDHNALDDGLYHNALTCKLGFDFTFNLGSAKAWQIYAEPFVNYNMHGYLRDGDDIKYNKNKAQVGVLAGINYKFGNSNGTHNFKLVVPRSQAEIDGLNSQINDLRNANAAKDAELAAKDAKINDLQKALDDCNSKPKYVKPATATNLQPTVLFKVGRSTIEPAQYAPIELIANYMKNHPDATVEIKGYASPEGSKEINQKLSEARAEAVKTALVKKYKIAANRLTTKGMGATDKLFEQVEFNRVATFNDNAK